jgi:hypothetical protein
LVNLSFNSALRSMETYISRPQGSDYTSNGSNALGHSTPESYSEGMTPDNMLMAMAGGKVRSRDFLKFGAFGNIMGKGGAQKLGGGQQSGGGIPDYVSMFLKGGALFGGVGGGMGGGVGGLTVGPTSTPTTHAPGSVGKSSGSMSISSGGADETPSISDAAIDKAETELTTKRGYGTAEADQIIFEAETAADGDIGRFAAIMNKVPKKPEQGEMTDEQFELVQDQWHKDFGKWYAQHIKGLDGTRGASFVDDAAYETEANPDRTIAVVKDPSTTVKGSRWRVTEGGGDVAEGDYLIYSGGEWKKADGSPVALKGKSPNGKTGSKGRELELQLPAAETDEFYQLDYQKIDESGNEVYDYADQSGTTGTIYRNGSGKWFEDEAGTKPIKGGKYDDVHKRLVFKRAPRTPVEGLGDTREYMAHLDDGYGDYETDVDAAGTQKTKIREGRIAAFKAGVEDAIPEALKGKVEVEVSADGRRVEITVADGNADAVAKAFATDVESGKFNKAFKLLPKGMRVQFNGATFSVGSDPHTKISAEIKGMPRALEVAEVDASTAKDAKGVKVAIRKAVKAALKAQGTRKAQSIEIGEITLPKSIVTKAEVKALVEEATSGLCTGVVTHEVAAGAVYKSEPAKPVDPIAVTTTVDLEGDTTADGIKAKIMAAVVAKLPGGQKAKTIDLGNITLPAGAKKADVEAAIEAVAKEHVEGGEASKVTYKVVDAPTEPKLDAPKPIKVDVELTDATSVTEIKAKIMAAVKAKVPSGSKAASIDFGTIKLPDGVITETDFNKIIAEVAIDYVAGSDLTKVTCIPSGDFKPSAAELALAKKKAAAAKLEQDRIEQQGLVDAEAAKQAALAKPTDTSAEPIKSPLPGTGSPVIPTIASTDGSPALKPDYETLLEGAYLDIQPTAVAATLAALGRLPESLVGDPVMVEDDLDMGKPVHRAVYQEAMTKGVVAWCADQSMDKGLTAPADKAGLVYAALTHVATIDDAMKGVALGFAKPTKPGGHLRTSVTQENAYTMAGGKVVHSKGVTRLVDIHQPVVKPGSAELAYITPHSSSAYTLQDGSGRPVVDVAAAKAEELKQQELAAAKAEELKQQELAAAKAEELKQQELVAAKAEELKQQELAAAKAEELKQQELAAAKAEELKQQELVAAKAEELKQQELAAARAEEEKQAQLAAAKLEETAPVAEGSADAVIKPTTDAILSEPYMIAGQSVDFILPDEFKGRLDAALPDIVTAAKTYVERVDDHRSLEDDEFDRYLKKKVVEGVATWAASEMEGWANDQTGNPENLSLESICASQSGECTERSNFLYAALKHAQRSSVTRRYMRAAEIKFAQVFQMYDGRREGHACLAITNGEDQYLLDIAYPGFAPTVIGGITSVTPRHKQYEVIDRDAYVASLLVNKTNSMPKDTPAQRAAVERVLLAAAELGDDNAFVLTAVVEHFFNAAVDCQRGRPKAQRAYAQRAKDYLGSVRKAQGWDKVKVINRNFFRGIDRQLRALLS